ncbi:MAG: carboxypeptidase-like regulatory domain-containing protein [Bacteroidota bacterium]
MKNNFKHLAFIAFITCLLLASKGQAQLIKTSLTITVRDELGNTVAGASVQLFEKEEDYTTEKNSAAEGTTDEKGVVKFKNLKSLPYFVLARKDDKDNAGGGEQTGKLEEKKFNKVTIVIQ